MENVIFHCGEDPLPWVVNIYWWENPWSRREEEGGSAAAILHVGSWPRELEFRPGELSWGRGAPGQGGNGGGGGAVLEQAPEELVEADESISIFIQLVKEMPQLLKGNNTVIPE